MLRLAIDAAPAGSDDALLLAGSLCVALTLARWEQLAGTADVSGRIAITEEDHAAMFKRLFGTAEPEPSPAERWAVAAYLKSLMQVKAAQTRLLSEVGRGSPDRVRLTHNVATRAEILWFRHTCWRPIPAVAAATHAKWSESLDLFAHMTLNVALYETRERSGTRTRYEAKEQRARRKWLEELGRQIRRVTKEAERDERDLIKRMRFSTDEERAWLTLALARVDETLAVSDEDQAAHSERVGQRIRAQIEFIDNRYGPLL